MLPIASAAIGRRFPLNLEIGGASTAWDMVKGIAGNLAPVDENIVAPACLGIDTHLVEHKRHHVDILVESQLYVLIAGDIGEHHVGHVGIDTSAPALAPEGLNVVSFAKVKVHFALNQLIASEYDGRLHLPHEEAVVAIVQCAGNVFFHSKIEAETPYVFVRKSDIFHDRLSA